MKSEGVRACRHMRDELTTNGDHNEQWREGPLSDAT